MQSFEEQVRYVRLQRTILLSFLDLDPLHFLVHLLKVLLQPHIGILHKLEVDVGEFELHLIEVLYRERHQVAVVQSLDLEVALEVVLLLVMLLFHCFLNILEDFSVGKVNVAE
jgi:hypothetical protein